LKKYNFDEVIDRRGSGALKTDALRERYGKTDLIPLWVADMDFRTGDFIIEALEKRCEHGIFGYPVMPEDYIPSIIRWIDNKHQWRIEADWISYVPGIVKAIGFITMCFSKPGNKIIIQPPVYHPFRIVPEANKRVVVNNPLVERDGKYTMNLDGLRNILKKESCRLLILCNPHNPIGIAWSREVLSELAEICYDNQVLVVSDEIHADMTLFGHKHVPFATVSDKAKYNSITLMAPSKTFNIAGIVSSFAIIPDKNIRDAFFEYLHASELDEANLFAYVATHAAYTQGAEWLSQMLEYLEGNIRFTAQFFSEHIPLIKPVIPEASFLVWLDCRALHLTQSELVSLFVDKAGLALNDGAIFGKEGVGFMRMNIGCPRAILEKALNKLKVAIINK